jgi:ATP-dependent DNA helicase RecQ
VIDVLRGQLTDKVTQRGHDALSTFGIGKDLDDAQWRAVLRQLVTLRLVAVDHDTYGVLRLAPASRDVLRGERRLTLRRDTAPPAGGRRRRKSSPAPGAGSAAAVAVSPEQEAVFQVLREWRRGVAQEHAVPAYTVLHDATLREIARRMPADIAQLGGISGMGSVKVARFGADLVHLVQSARETEAA